MTPEELAAAAAKLKAIENKLKAEGFASIEEVIAAHGTAVAELKKAETARDKFKEDNDKAREIIRSKGGEKAALLQEIEDLKAAQGDTGGTGGGGTGKPAAQTPPVKTVEEELAEVEAGLTDEQWTAADAYLEKMDDATALQYAEDKKTRLEFLKGLKNDPALKTLARPKSFRPQAAAATPDAQPPENAYTAAQRLLGRVIPGPGGRVAPKGPTVKADPPQAGWLKGN